MKSQGRFGEFSLSKAGFLETTDHTNFMYSQGLAHDLPAYLAIKLEAIETRCRQPNMIVLYCPVHLLAPAHC